MDSHTPRKRFGQHFLHERRTIERIVAAFDPRPGEHVVEIGPGQGALTQELLRRAQRLDAIELDRDLAAPLEESCRGLGELVVHGADALKFDFCELVQGTARLRVIGNLPYNISTPLLFHLLDQAHCIQDMCFMLQKEVVDRLAATPGNKAYGRLSVMVQWRCDVVPLFTVAPGAFRPPPKVDSAVVRLMPKQSPLRLLDEKLFAEVVRAAFAQRRKSLRNSLKRLARAEEFVAAAVDPGLRAEALSLEQFVRLSNTIATRVDRAADAPD